MTRTASALNAANAALYAFSASRSSHWTCSAINRSRRSRSAPFWTAMASSCAGVVDCAATTGTGLGCTLGTLIAAGAETCAASSIRCSADFISTLQIERHTDLEPIDRGDRGVRFVEAQAEPLRDGIQDVRSDRQISSQSRLLDPRWPVVLLGRLGEQGGRDVHGRRATGGLALLLRLCVRLCFCVRRALRCNLVALALQFGALGLDGCALFCRTHLALLALGFDDRSLFGLARFAFFAFCLFGGARDAGQALLLGALRFQFLALAFDFGLLALALDRHSMQGIERRDRAHLGAGRLADEFVELRLFDSHRLQSGAHGVDFDRSRCSEQGRDGADLLDALADARDALALFLLALGALHLAALFVGLDLPVDRLFQFQDFCRDALGFGVEQIDLLQHRRLGRLADALQLGARALEFEPRGASGGVALRGGNLEHDAFVALAQVGQTGLDARVFCDVPSFGFNDCDFHVRSEEHTSE